MTIEQRILIALGFALIAGCAGYRAMAIEHPPVRPPCGILVCEPWGTNKVDVERDCKCSGKQTLPEIQ